MTSGISMVPAMALSILAIAMPVQAHHSFAAQYDSTKPITLTGTVTKVEWMNPHIYFYIDVADPDTGEAANWAFEMGGPNALIRLGWSRNSMQPGDVVTVQGTLARDGSRLVNTRDIVLTSTGRKLLAGSSEGDAD